MVESDFWQPIRKNRIVKRFHIFSLWLRREKKLTWYNHFYVWLFTGLLHWRGRAKANLNRWKSQWTRTWKLVILFSRSFNDDPGGLRKSTSLIKRKSNVPKLLCLIILILATTSLKIKKKKKKQMGIANNTLLRRIHEYNETKYSNEWNKKKIFFLLFMTFNSEKKLLSIWYNFIFCTRNLETNSYNFNFLVLPFYKRPNNKIDLYHDVWSLIKKVFEPQIYQWNSRDFIKKILFYLLD